MGRRRECNTGPVENLAWREVKDQGALIVVRYVRILTRRKLNISPGKHPIGYRLYYSQYHIQTSTQRWSLCTGVAFEGSEYLAGSRQMPQRLLVPRSAYVPPLSYGYPAIQAASSLPVQFRKAQAQLILLL